MTIVFRVSKLSLTVLFTMCASLPAQESGRKSIHTEGWRIDANEGTHSLTIGHDRLGIVLEAVRLGVRSQGRLQESTEWSVLQSGDNRLVIRSLSPRATWEFNAAAHTLKISCTSSQGQIRAKAPAPQSRIVARTIDTEGPEVSWQGTSEIADNFGGPVTRNVSHLPRTNPETMYFALGQISSPRFHSLFDRKTDTAVIFSEDAEMERSERDEDELEIKMPVEGNTLIRVIPDYFVKQLGLPSYTPFDDTYFKTAPTVWSSWTSYYDKINENEIIRNADWLASNLKPYGFRYVQLDDGYDELLNGQHTWIGKWDADKFPHGPKWLTQSIKSKGLRPGIWLVPNAYAGALNEHPDWYLRDKSGKLILDYATPSLDSTNPAVLGFLKRLFNTLDDWGFEYYKFDGEHAIPKYVPAVDKTKLHDPSADPLVTYRERLRLIRNTIGPERFVEGCPAGTPLNGIGFFNSYFNGQDLYNNWQGMYALFSSINANAFLNHLAVYVMPGEGLELGEPMTVEEAKRKRPRIVIDTARSRENPLIGFGTTMAEARTLVTYISLTGVAYPLASIMPELPEARVALLKATMPTLPILPVDLYSRGTDSQWDTFKHVTQDDYIHNYPEVLDLKISAALGRYDAVGLTNWRSAPDRRSLSFPAELGLDKNASYVVFDFWNRKLLGVFKDKIDLDIAPHDTRVLLIHPLLSRPQLLGTSRHITGGYSVSGLSWNSSRKTLEGEAETIPGDRYHLWLYVPDGMRVVEVSADAGPGVKHPLTQQRSGDLLTVAFAGAAKPIHWRIRLSTR
jgi:Melibiase/Alpha galactosidase C-terminal beta sandwich domain